MINTPDREDPSIEYIPNRKVAIGVYLGILSQFCITLYPLFQVAGESAWHVLRTSASDWLWVPSVHNPALGFRTVLPIATDCTNSRPLHTCGMLSGGSVVVTGGSVVVTCGLVVVVVVVVVV